MKSAEVKAAISGLNFQQAVDWCLKNLKNAMREGMGDKNIARVACDEKEFGAVMFFTRPHGNHSTASFCFNN